MRALLERSGLARTSLVALSALCVMGLVHAAGAENNSGLRLVAFEPPPEEVQAAQPAPVLTVTRRWAGPARGRWRSALHAHRHGVSGSRAPHRSAEPRLVRARKPAAPRVAAEPRLIFLPPPTKPAIVSIYADRTLRRGDAVMLADGVHVFRGVGTGPFRRADFVRLSVVAGLDLHLRQTLDAFDHNPPTRWSSLESGRG